MSSLYLLHLRVSTLYYTSLFVKSNPKFVLHLGFVYGLVNFFRDIFPGKRKRDVTLFALSLLPPYVIAVAGGSSVFTSALDAVGTYGITLLFGGMYVPCIPL